MKTALILCAWLFLVVGCSARADDYHDLNDCMAGDYESAILACTRLLERKGNGGTSSANLYTLRGWAHAETGKNNEAIADFDKALGLAPKAMGTYDLRAVVYGAMGRKDRMQADFAQASALNKEMLGQAPKDAIQSFCTGLGLQTIGTTLAAISGYDLAIQVDPRLAAAYVMRSEVQATRQEYDKALEGLEKALQLDPKYSAAYLRRAQIYRQQNQSDKALADFTKAIELNPQYSAAYFGRGYMLEQTNQFDKAIADFDKSIALRPDYVRGIYWRGFTYEKKGDKEHAVADYRKVLALEPTQLETREAMKRLGVEP